MADREHAERDPVPRLELPSATNVEGAKQSDTHVTILDACATPVKRRDTERIPGRIPTPLSLARMRPLTLVLALLAAPPNRMRQQAASAKPTHSDGKRRPADADARPACPNPHGGACLGALEPGTYTTVTFSPAITYTVPAGWTNGEDLPGNFLLQLDGDPRYIGIYRDVNAPYKCEEHSDPDVSQTVSDYTRWLRRHPLLHVTKPRPVALGGLHGVAMDISKAPGTKGKGCTFGETSEGAVPFIVGGRGPASLHHVVLDRPASRSASTCCATGAATSRSKSAPKATAWPST